MTTDVLTGRFRPLSAGRAHARTLLTRGGSRMAELGTRPGSHRVILRAVPAMLERRFDPASARNLKAVMELRVRDVSGDGVTRFAVRIENETCAVTAGAAERYGAAVQIGADDMIRLVTGVVGWPQLVSSKRLEMSGDPFLALRFPQLFRLPATVTAAGHSVR